MSRSTVSELFSLGQRFWSLSAAEPLDIPNPTKVFVVNRDAWEPLSDFVADRERAEAMTKAINDMRTKIPPLVIAAVRDLDGTPSDLAIMLAGIVVKNAIVLIDRVNQLREEGVDKINAIVEYLKALK